MDHLACHPFYSFRRVFIQRKTKEPAKLIDTQRSPNPPVRALRIQSSASSRIRP